ncbi:hypothetical protein ACRJ4W_38815 [Streptomyces sp. GLT-R25]
MLATSTRSTSAGVVPACARAFSAAVAAIISRVSSSSAKRRSTMPLRVSIHSSVESMSRQISALPTTRRGR